MSDYQTVFREPHPEEQKVTWTQHWLWSPAAAGWAESAHASVNHSRPLNQQFINPFPAAGQHFDLDSPHPANTGNAPLAQAAFTDPQFAAATCCSVRSAANSWRWCSRTRAAAFRTRSLLCWTAADTTEVAAGVTQFPGFVLQFSATNWIFHWPSA